MYPQRPRTVVGTFHFCLEAERALRTLREAGFGRNEIGVAMRRADKGGEGAPNGNLDQRTTQGAPPTTLNGMDLNALLTLGVRSGVVPGVGPTIAIGPLSAIFSDAAANNGTKAGRKNNLSKFVLLLPSFSPTVETCRMQRQSNGFEPSTSRCPR
jgi:hypothetical protein